MRAFLVRTVTVGLLTAFISIPAFALTQDWEGLEDGWTVVSGNSGTIGSDFFLCQAKGRFNQYCYDAVEAWSVQRQRYERRCARVTAPAHCQCDLATFATKGMCTWEAR